MSAPSSFDDRDQRHEKHAKNAAEALRMASQEGVEDSAEAREPDYPPVEILLAEVIDIWTPGPCAGHICLLCMSI
jgi:hypothetical protein